MFLKLALYKVVYQLLNTFRYSFDIDHFNGYWLGFFQFAMHFFVNKILQPFNTFVIAVITKVSERNNGTELCKRTLTLIRTG